MQQLAAHRDPSSTETSREKASQRNDSGLSGIGFPLVITVDTSSAAREKFPDSPGLSPPRSLPLVIARLSIGLCTQQCRKNAQAARRVELRALNIFAL